MVYIGNTTPQRTDSAPGQKWRFGCLAFLTSMALGRAWRALARANAQKRAKCAKKAQKRVWAQVRNLSMYAPRATRRASARKCSSALRRRVSAFGAWRQAWRQAKTTKRTGPLWAEYLVETWAKTGVRRYMHNAYGCMRVCEVVGS